MFERLTRKAKQTENDESEVKEDAEQSVAWWRRKKVIASVVSGCVASALFFTGWGVHLNDSTYLTRSYGAVGAAADGLYSGLDDLFGIQAQIKGDDGHGGGVTYAGRDSMGVTDAGLLYAPKPATEFRNADCPLYPAGVNGSSAEPPKSVGSRTAGWWAPSLRSKTQVVQGAVVTPSGFSNNDVRLPAAPNGIWYASGSPLSSNEGASILAGHINLNDGNLSPWGYLHRLDKCSHIYLNDEHGNRHEFVVTGLYLVKQDELASHSELWRKDGDKKAYFITCSGNSVGTDGTREASSTFLFNYEYNLIVEGTPVDGSYPKPAPKPTAGKTPVVTEIPSVSTPSASPEATPSPSVTSDAPAAPNAPATEAPAPAQTSENAAPTVVTATPEPQPAQQAPVAANNAPVKSEATTGTVVTTNRAKNNNLSTAKPDNTASAKPSASPTPSASATSTRHITKN